MEPFKTMISKKNVLISFSSVSLPLLVRSALISFRTQFKIRECCTIPLEMHLHQHRDLYQKQTPTDGNDTTLLLTYQWKYYNWNACGAVLFFFLSFFHSISVNSLATWMKMHASCNNTKNLTVCLFWYVAFVATTTTTHR